MDEVDVLIVGGGIAGASLGARLAGDLRVTLIEAEDICGRHATGRSAAFWQASLGGDTPERRLSLASKPMFDENWPGSESPFLRPRGAVHLTGPSGERMDEADELAGEYAPVHLTRAELDRLIPGLRKQWTGAWYESSCADIEVAAFHQACLAGLRRRGDRSIACFNYPAGAIPTCRPKLGGNSNLTTPPACRREAGLVKGRDLDVRAARFIPGASPLLPQPGNQPVELVATEADRRIFAGKVVQILRSLSRRACQVHGPARPQQGGFAARPVFVEHRLGGEA